MGHVIDAMAVSYGIAGLVAALFIYLYITKDKELTTQSKDHNSQIVQLQREVISAVTLLAVIVEQMKKDRSELEAVRKELDAKRAELLEREREILERERELLERERGHDTRRSSR